MAGGLLTGCLALAALSHFAWAQTPAPELPKMSEIPLLDCSGLPCVTLTTGSGKSLRLLIDFGDINSYLTTSAANSQGLAMKPLASAGDAGVQQTVVPDARLGDLPMGDFPFMVLDATPDPNNLNGQAQPLPGDGALTFSAFKNRLVELDLAHKLLRVSQPQESAAPCPGGCNQLVIKRFGQFGPATLTSRGFTLNGQPLDVQIDTLFTGTVLVYADAVKRLDLKKAAKAHSREVFPFTQGGVKLVRSEGAAEGYEGQTLWADAPVYFFPADAPLVSARFDGTVGSGLLARGVFTFDFKGMTMWMEPSR